MLKIRPEFLTKNGRREFVVLTTEDFDRVIEALEDVEDLRILRRARRRNVGSRTFPLNEVRRRLVSAARAKSKI
jgi:hypothetical protein